MILKHHYVNKLLLRITQKCKNYSPSMNIFILIFTKVFSSILPLKLSNFF